MTGTANIFALHPKPKGQREIVRILAENLPNINALESEIETNFTKSETLRQSILKKAFAGELIPQDPSDEPHPNFSPHSRQAANFS
jgi:hypothetical protein